MYNSEHARTGCNIYPDYDTNIYPFYDMYPDYNVIHIPDYSINIRPYSINSMPAPRYQPKQPTPPYCRQSNPHASKEPTGVGQKYPQKSNKHVPNYRGPTSASRTHINQKSQPTSVVARTQVAPNVSNLLNTSAEFPNYDNPNDIPTPEIISDNAHNVTSATSATSATTNKNTTFNGIRISKLISENQRLRQAIKTPPPKPEVTIPTCEDIETENEGLQCCICLLNEKRIALGCGHCFCRSCIVAHFNINKDCPTCRQTIATAIRIFNETQ